MTRDGVLEGVPSTPTLPGAWRERGALLRRHGATEAAATLNTVADELEMSLRAEADDVLTLAAAAAASGFSRDHLTRLLRAGTIRNVGRRHAPRIRRADLPRKVRAIAATGVKSYDPVADARSLASRLQTFGGEHGGQ